ncbi:hypothetical protein [Sinimarinibacterium flocculans]|uniref:hypothetical protein n=1 Tax=Sinimarinibacterium flocculans TaxID=985250 RepID=UPI003515D148
MVTKSKGMLAGVSIIAMVACSGDGGADRSDDSEKAVALRELGALTLILGGPRLGPESESHTLYFSSYPVGGPSSDCDAGAANAEEGTRTRRLNFLAGSGNDASYTRYTFEDCALANPAGLQNGQVEVGHIGEYDPLDPNSTFQLYAEYGGNSGPFVLTTTREEVAGSPVAIEEQISGVVEQKGDDGRTEVGSRLSRTTTRSDGYWLEWRQGADDGFFFQARSGSSVDVSGSYSYRSSTCSGGARRVHTTVALVTDVGRGPIGGSITISSESGDIEFTFSDDGSGMAMLEDGSVVNFSSQEAANAFESFGC